MEFLDKLYSNENFGIVLIMIIAILVVLFIIVLVLGMRDKRKRELEKTIKLDVDTSKELEAYQEPVAFKDTKEDESPLDLAAMETVMNLHSVSTNEDAITPLNTESKGDDISQILANANLENSQIIDEQKTFDFNALADSISKELESIGIQVDDVEQEPVKEMETTLVKAEPEINESPISFEKDDMPVIEAYDFASEEPEFIETVKEVEEIKTEETLTKEEQKEIELSETKRVEMPKVFSSVFINRDAEKASAGTKNVQEKSSPTTVKPLPTKPDMEMPKAIELPKKVDEVNDMPKPLNNSTTENPFSNVSGETYNIK